MTTSTPNSGSGKPGPRIVKPSTTDDRTSPPPADSFGPKPIRGKRKSLTGRLGSNSPKVTPKQQLVGSPATSVRSQPSAFGKNSPQGPRKSAASSGPSPIGARRSVTPDKTASSPLTKSDGARRSVPASPSIQRAAPANKSSPRSSPRVTRTPQTTPRSNSRTLASPKPTPVGQKPSSEPKPKTMVREGTFTKEPSPSVRSVTVDQNPDGNSSPKGRDVTEQASALTLPAVSDTTPEQPSTGTDLPKTSDEVAASDENNTTAADAAVTIPPDYIAYLLLGDNGPAGSPRLKSSAASRSVGNLMSINSSTARPLSPRSGPTTPTVGRKSIDTQLTEIAAAASKKSTRNKISSLWHRDKPAKGKTSTALDTSQVRCFHYFLLSLLHKELGRMTAVHHYLRHIRLMCDLQAASNHTT